MARKLRQNMTPAEKIIWERIRKKSLGIEFHRQVPVLYYIIDFYCHEIGLAIEIDGSIHEHNFLEDAERQGKLEKYGIHFLRFTNDEILNELEQVIKVIEAYIVENT